jgi:hypothetical protein
MMPAPRSHQPVGHENALSSGPHDERCLYSCVLRFYLQNTLSRFKSALPVPNSVIMAKCTFPDVPVM